MREKEKELLKQGKHEQALRLGPLIADLTEQEVDDDFRKSMWTVLAVAVAIATFLFIDQSKQRPSNAPGPPSDPRPPVDTSVGVLAAELASYSRASEEKNDDRKLGSLNILVADDFNRSKALFPWVDRMFLGDVWSEFTNNHWTENREFRRRVFEREDRCKKNEDVVTVIVPRTPHLENGKVVFGQPELFAMYVERGEVRATVPATASIKPTLIGGRKLDELKFDTASDLVELKLHTFTTRIAKWCSEWWGAIGFLGVVVGLFAGPIAESMVAGAGRWWKERKEAKAIETPAVSQAGVSSIEMQPPNSNKAQAEGGTEVERNQPKDVGEDPTSPRGIA